MSCTRTGGSSLEGRVAVVTGATGGIGAAVCRALAVAGACIVVGYRRDGAAAETLVNSLPSSEAAANHHTALQVDVASGSSLDAFRAAIDRRFDAIDLLVNSVGTTRFVAHADLNGLDDGLIDDIFRTNWRGPFATIRALQPLLARKGNGLVVNISSVAATTGIGSNVAYCASKAALNAMTVSLARALAPAIRVVSVSPGVVETGFISGLDKGWRDEQAKRTPMGRFASPDDVGAAVLAMATTLAYSTGCIIPVDGGRPLW